MKGDPISIGRRNWMLGDGQELCIVCADRQATKFLVSINDWEKREGASGIFTYADLKELHHDLSELIAEMEAAQHVGRPTKI